MTATHRHPSASRPPTTVVKIHIEPGAACRQPPSRIDTPVAPGHNLRVSLGLGAHLCRLRQPGVPGDPARVGAPRSLSKNQLKLHKDLRREPDAPVLEISGKTPHCHVKQRRKLLSTIDLILGQAPSQHLTISILNPANAASNDRNPERFFPNRSYAVVDLCPSLAGTFWVPWASQGQQLARIAPWTSPDSHVPCTQMSTTA